MDDTDEGSGGAETYRERIERLSAKLNVVHEGVASGEKASKYDYLQEKVRKLDEKVAVSVDASQKKFSVIREQLVQFQKEVDHECKSRDDLANAQGKGISDIDKNMHKLLAAEQKELKDTEQRILQAFASKTNALKEQLTSSSKQRLENEANLRKYLDVDIPRLYEALKEEVNNREAMEQRMLRKAMEEVTQLQSAVLEEKKAREDTEEAMLRMMEDVVAKMQSEIATERQERERTEEMLLNLLHDTCHKLQVASQSL